MNKNVGLLVIILFTCASLAVSVQGKDCKHMRYENRNNVNPKPLEVSTISGIVQDDDAVPIPEACVGIFKQHRLVAYTQTDKSGEFALPQVASGDYEIVVTYDPYCTANIRLRLHERNKKSKHRKLLVQLKASQIDGCSEISYG